MASIIIPTYNGAHRIARAIRALSTQSILPDEVVVVVDGSSDNTLDVLDGLAKEFKTLHIKVVVQPNSGRSEAKNRGILEATSDLLVFLDDDMEPVPSWLESHVKHHLAVADSLASGSLLAPPVPERNELQRYQAWLHSAWHPPSDSNSSCELCFPYVHAGNFSAHKKTLMLLGNFYSGLRDCEDRLLALTALEHAVRLFLLPAAQCTHHDTHCSSFVNLGVRAREYECARSRLVLHEPSFLRYAPLRPFQPKSGWAWLYRLLRYRLVLQAADFGLFRLLPCKFRYRFYSLIVTAFSRSPLPS